MRLSSHPYPISPTTLVELYVGPQNHVPHQLEAWLSTASGPEADEYLEALDALYPSSQTTPDFYQALLLVPNLSPWALDTLRLRDIDTRAYQATRTDTRPTLELVNLILSLHKSPKKRGEDLETINSTCQLLLGRPDLTDAHIAKLYKSRPSSLSVRDLFHHPSAGDQSVRVLFRNQTSRNFLLSHPQLSTKLYTSPSLLAAFYDVVKEFCGTLGYAPELRALGGVATRAIAMHDAIPHPQLSLRINAVLDLIEGTSFSDVEQAYGMMPTYLGIFLSSTPPHPDRLDNATIARLLAHPMFKALRPPLFEYLRPPTVPRKPLQPNL